LKFLVGAVIRKGECLSGDLEILAEVSYIEVEEGRPRRRKCRSL